MASACFHSVCAVLNMRFFGFTQSYPPPTTTVWYLFKIICGTGNASHIFKRIGLAAPNHSRTSSPTTCTTMHAIRAINFWSSAGNTICRQSKYQDSTTNYCLSSSCSCCFRIAHDMRTRPASTIAHATNATNIQPNSPGRPPKCYQMRSTSATVATWRRPAPMPFVLSASGCGVPYSRWLWWCWCVACDIRHDHKCAGWCGLCECVWGCVRVWCKVWIVVCGVY